MRFFIGVIALAAGLYGQGAGGVQFRDWAKPAADAKPKSACAELRGLTNYEFTVINATVVAATPQAPEHCRVSVLIAPEINIEVNLPAAWNGRLYMFGNGGFAGESFEAANRVANRARGLSAGFATAATDTGHSAALEPAATFAANKQKLVDFAFRSLHLTAATAKLLVNAYYGQAPSKSYFDGCSQGGRQGLMLAQRFPADFDGIVAGAPGLGNSRGRIALGDLMPTVGADPTPAPDTQSNAA